VGAHTSDGLKLGTTRSCITGPVTGGVGANYEFKVIILYLNFFCDCMRELPQEAN